MPSKIYFQNESPDYEYSTTFDGIEYIVRFTWNSVTESWYLSIRNYAGEELINGIRVITGMSLLDRFRRVDLPSGSIICIQNQSGSLVSPTRTSFSEGTHELIYFTREELDEVFT